jgi:hypothetical protein
MGKREDKRKADTAKQLADVCLHCVFFQTHRDKWPDWPDWKPDADRELSAAFNDLVESAIKITAVVFSMLDESDQMAFMRQVKAALNGPTEH